MCLDHVNDRGSRFVEDILRVHFKHMVVQFFSFQVDLKGSLMG